MPELNQQKKQQMEAIKLLSDWSKWLVTLETGGVAGVVSLISVKDVSGLNKICIAALSLLLVVAAISFLISIFNACMLLFSLPSVVEQLPKSECDSIDYMQDSFFKTPLIDYQRRQYLPFVTGLVCIGIALLLYVFARYLPPILFPQHA